MNPNILRRFIQVLFVLILQAVLLFLSAGTTAWRQAWMFLMISVLLLIVNLFVVPRDVIEERGRRKKDAKRWDKILSGINIVPTVLMYVTAGLDYRLEWTGPAIHRMIIPGLFLVVAGSLLFTWSMVSNPFFSTMVRLQEDRGHRVASSGPYRIVRHPGYTGYIIMTAGTPLALGTIPAFIFAGMTIVLLIVRTSLEDSTLQQELDGYREYTDQVRYRLFPLLW